MAIAASVIVAVAVRPATAQTPAAEQPLFNGYDRPKNGPPLTNIFNKARPAWIRKKLRNPQHHPAARMPHFRFSEDEVLTIMAYLRSIATPTPGPDWPAWAHKSLDDMEDDDEIDAMFELSEQGLAVWSNSRCTVCHTIHGPGDTPIGGFVDLRVGGIDLQIEATKLKRDWLYRWIKDPKDHFPETLMPRFRLSEQEIRAMVEYILRDDAFLPAEVDEPLTDADRAVLDDPDAIRQGRQLMELDRCVVCHRVEGIEEGKGQDSRRVRQSRRHLDHRQTRASSSSTRGFSAARSRSGT